MTTKDLSSHSVPGRPPEEPPATNKRPGFDETTGEELGRNDPGARPLSGNLPAYVEALQVLVIVRFKTWQACRDSFFNGHGRVIGRLAWRCDMSSVWVSLVILARPHPGGTTRVYHFLWLITYTEPHLSQTRTRVSPEDTESERAGLTREYF